MDEALQIGNLACEAIEGLKISHANSPISAYVTASVGVSAMIPTVHSSHEDLFLAADSALYEVKAKGRNQAKGINNSNHKII